MEKRTYDVEQTCKRLKCDRENIREAVLQELANEYLPSTDFVFDKIDNKTMQVSIIPEEEQKEKESI